MKTEIYNSNDIATINQLAEYCEMTINAGMLDMLSPGTYTASQIHRALMKIDQDYVDYNNSVAAEYASAGETDIDVRYKLFRITDEFGWWLVPGGNTFKRLGSYEKSAGWSTRKAHHFNIHESRPAAIESVITFESQDIMMKLSKIVNKKNVRGHKKCVLSLGDGCLRGRSTTYKYNNRGKKEVVFVDEPFCAAPSEYGGMKEFRTLSFLIKADDIKHLYGECKISLYKDEKTTADKNNPYNYRVVITNSDGWMISSDVLVDFSANTFDRQSGFEPIPNVSGTTESAEGQSTANEICRAEKSHHIVSNSNKQVSRSGKKSFAVWVSRMKRNAHKKPYQKRRLRGRYIEHSVKKLRISR